MAGRASLVPLWVLTGSWQAPLVVGASSLVIMVVAHLWQTHRRHGHDQQDDDC